MSDAELSESRDCPSCAQMKQWYGPDGNAWRDEHLWMRPIVEAATALKRAWERGTQEDIARCVGALAAAVERKTQ